VEEAEFETLLEKFKETVFKAGLGEVKEITAQLTVKPNTTAKFCKPRPVSYAVKPKLRRRGIR